MDGDVERIHEVLLNAGFAANIADVQTPTPEFIVNLITKFLMRFSIDANTIQRPTFEQQQAMSYPEVYHDTIGLINLHEVVAGICKQIFLKDFCITDITNPGPKRARRQAGLLSNFVLYATNKMSDLEDRVNDILISVKTFQNLVQKKNNLMESINQKALHNAAQLAPKEKYEKQIAEIRLQIEKDKKRKTEVEEATMNVEQKRQKVLQKNGSLKADALKLSKITAELESKVVRSPEEYKIRLNELKMQSESKMEKREEMREAIHDKKHLIEQIEKIIDFIQEQCKKFSKVKETYQQFKESNKKLEDLTKQIEEVNAAIDKLTQELVEREDERGIAEIDDLNVQCEQRLSSLRTLHAQLLCEDKLAEEKSEEIQDRQHEIFVEKDNITRAIVKLEEKISIFLNDCQELYNKEIGDEKKLQNVWKSFHN